MATFDISGIKTNQAIPISINFSSSGDNTIVSGISGQTVRIWRLFLVVSAATNLTFKNGASIVLSGPLPMLANGSVVLDLEGDPWFVTSSGQSFVINQSGSATVGGTCYFSQSA